MRAYEFLQEAKYNYPLSDFEATPYDPGFEFLDKARQSVGLDKEPHIGPQEGKYLNLMLKGIKPATVIDSAEERELFRPYIKNGTIKVAADDGRSLFLTLPGEEWRGPKLQKLFQKLGNARNDPDHNTDKEKVLDAKIGRLLGLPKESVRYFLKTRYKINEDAKNTVKVYHGSNKLFDEFSQSKARIINDLYGGGIAYFTDSPDIAASYARVMTKKYGGSPVVYKVELNLGKVFDVDDKFSGSDLMKFVNHADSVESFLRGARLLSLGVDRYKIIDNLKSGKMKLTGEQIFRGLSNGMVNTTKARKILQNMGYDTLRYNGGRIPGQHHHNIYLAYYADGIKILDVDTKEKD